MKLFRQLFNWIKKKTIMAGEVQKSGTRIFHIIHY